MSFTTIVFAGGVGLGAYQGGAYEAFVAQGGRADWLLGASVGAVNAAIVAGNPPEKRIERLRTFWESNFWPSAAAAATTWPSGMKWLSALQSRFVGSPGRFAPNLFGFTGSSVFPGLYDLAPLRASLDALIDYDYLNAGAMRLTINATDVASGEPVVFDTARGDRIGPDHLLATCGFFPDFPMMEIDGRLLADGGYSANAPISPLKQAPELDGKDLTCFVLDLYAADGYTPGTLDQCFARRNELTFGNQTRSSLADWRSEHELRAALRQAASPSTPDRLLHGPASVRALHIAYRPPQKDASPLTPFDFSPLTLSQRWDAGRRDMEAAMGAVGGPPATPFDLRMIPTQPAPGG